MTYYSKTEILTGSVRHLAQPRAQEKPYKRYDVRMATRHELDDVFKLRYDVFYTEMGASDSVSLVPGLDVDIYDDLCDHPKFPHLWAS